MKLIIAGTRDLYINSPLSIEFILVSLELFPDEIVSGGARGIDLQGEIYAGNNGKKLKLFEPDWENYGKIAGPIRNKQMAQYADALLLIWDGQSRGSKNMKKEMLALNKPVYEIIIRKHN